MSVRNRFAFYMLLLVVAALPAAGPVYAQAGGQRYFDQTGHWVTGEFLSAYESIPNAQLLYGYPITEAFQPAAEPDIALVQYFERARFELHTEKTGELRVARTMLGSILYDETAGKRVSIPASAPCKKVVGSEYRICYAFLDFFTAYGGIEQFGYPISELEIHDGWLVQYFQRARFEWRPERAAGERVVLTDIGRLFFLMHENQRQDLGGELIPHAVLSLKAEAFVENAVLSRSGSQTLYVIVKDQSGAPISRAQVTFSIILPTGETMPFLMPLTDDHGVTTLQFVLKDQPQGITEISVVVNSNQLEARTRTSYRIWY